MEIPLKLSREEGSVLVIALITLVLVTLIGIAASRTASIEISIAGNERSHLRDSLWKHGSFTGQFRRYADPTGH